ncbi:MAG: galactose-1-epimerase [Pirellulaceae bacterium]|nr:galactose-1-epimerase [Pirellulaceae bacterium]
MRSYAYLSCVLLAGCGLLPRPVAGADDLPAEPRPIRVGIIGLDAHAVPWTRILSDPSAPAAAREMQIVAAVAAPSLDIPFSADNIAQNTQAMREMGVEIVDTIEQLLPRVDAVMLLSIDGRPHLAQSRPVFAARKPLFIDKPVAASLADVVRIFELARSSGTPCFSSSSLRYCPGIASMPSDPRVGRVLGCDAYSSNAPLEPSHPDLFYYGIHGTELLFTIMGPGCQSVTRVKTPTADLAAGTWSDGRLGTFRGILQGSVNFGATVFGEQGIAPSGNFEGYEHLLVEIARFFRTGKPPVSAEQTLEIYAFMEAADESKRRGGTPVSLEEVLATARAAAAESEPTGAVDAKGNQTMNTRDVLVRPFGTTHDGVAVEEFTLRNAHGVTARVITYGATLTQLLVPDRREELADVVLGFDQLPQYEMEGPYFGCTVGRVAFRTTRGAFTLDGQTYQLTRNAGEHHLHGGVRGLSHVVWKAEACPGADGPAVCLRYRSPAGDQGYPGNLDVGVTYTLTDADELRIDYTASTDQATPVNLTHHSYFNLAGAGHGDVLDHVLLITADRYSPTDADLIPTGALDAVQGTPFDFTTPSRIGARIDQASGYDLAYLRRASEGVVATLTHPGSGRRLDVESTSPALVLYTGNYLDGSLEGKGGARYGQYAGVCLETGYLPDSLHQPAFPPIVLRPGDVYRERCVYRFSVE